MSQKTATVIGATGLVGNQLLDVLQLDDTFKTIRVLVRRPVTFAHPKVEVKLVDFNDSESFKLAIDGSDAIFCAVGTTQKKVKGNKEAYRKVDYSIPVDAARFCVETGCQQFLLVSSVGANSESNNFYLRLKGEVEEAIYELPVESISIFRPSVLIGKRTEFRLAEIIGQSAARFFAFLMLDKLEKYRPVEAEFVAKAMVQAAKDPEPGVGIYEFNEIRALSKELSAQLPTVRQHLVKQLPS